MSFRKRSLSSLFDGKKRGVGGRKQSQNLLEQKVTPLQQHDYCFELVNDGVMTRTMEGKINFWNRGAEKLYGWRKEEAIGRVSHDLLQTRFPKPLEEIESELVRNGRWEGRLVHTTREGGRVVVESRWTLDLNGQPGELVEINTRSPDPELAPAARTDTYGVETGRQEPVLVSKWMKAYDLLPKIASFVLAGGALLCVVAALMYGFFGHDLIKAIYEDQSLGIGNWLMEGRALTPLAAYYEAADRWLLLITLRVVAFLFVIAALAILLREPVGALLACCSFLLCSVLLFSFFELYPSLIRPFHLDKIGGYYGWKECCVPDDTLIYRYRPFFTSTSEFKGYMYSPVYGVDVPPLFVELSTDKNGFINNNATRNLPDILVIGDSFVGDALNEADTFGRRLESMVGLTVGNLGVPGYGPLQYLEVLKRYGIQQKPRYALFVFYAGNDIEDISEYLQWKRGNARYYQAEVLSQPFLSRYVVALKDGVHFLGSLGDTLFSMMLVKQSYYNSERIHPDIAVVTLGNHDYRMLIPAENKIKSSAELLASEEGQALRKTLAGFKEICAKNGIVPVIIYIPTVTTIYADHSNSESGKNWLRLRDEQIARKRNTEDAVAILARSMSLKLINLTPVFESAAADGKLLYQPFDTHWSSEGRQVAADHVAKILKSISRANQEKAPVTAAQ